jgi:hypothetical protein
MIAPIHPAAATESRLERNPLQSDRTFPDRFRPTLVLGLLLNALLPIRLPWL